MLGAFPFPYPQGSQIFVTDHTRALVRGGVEAQLFSYGSGLGEVPKDLDCVASPSWLSPVAMRSGPTLAKIPADAGLLATYLRAARAQKFDVAFAHNAEAAMIALAARAHVNVPVIYVAHTILRHELSAYGWPVVGSMLAEVGGVIDRFIGRRVDGIVALCDDAKRDLAPIARGPVEVIPPGLDVGEEACASEVASACSHHGLALGEYALYCGNLDGYQDLDLLAQAAALMSKGGGDPKVVVATHDATALPVSFYGVANLSCIEVENFAQMRALIAGAQSVVLCRQRRGGFPIKLLNYMEASKAIVAFQGIAPGFEHRESAWLLEEDAGAPQLAEALRALASNVSLRETLGQGARSLVETHHSWESLTHRTCALAETVIAQRSHP